MKVLVAEDDVAILDVVTIILEGEGHEVFQAANEKSVFVLANKHKPDIILLDVSLADSNGGEITQKLKADPETKDIPVIIVSANIKAESIAQTAGADGFLLKPFDIEDLVKVVTDHGQK